MTELGNHEPENALYRVVFGHMAIGISLVGMDGHPFRINPAEQQILGYSEAEIQQLSIVELTHPDDAAIVIENFQRLVAGDVTSYQVEKRFHRKDGQYIWGRLTASLVRAPDGAPQFAIGALEDITQYKVWEERLVLLETAFNQAADGIMITDANLDSPGPLIQMVNPAFTRITGYTTEELIEKSPRMLQGPQSERHVFDRLRQHLADGKEFFGVITNYRKDGSLFLLQIHITPIRSKQGEITHFLSIQRDVTEQHRIEAALLESRNQLAESQRLAHMGSFVLYLDLDKLLWTAELSRLVGHDPNALPPTPEEFFAMVHPDDREILQRTFQEIREGKRTHFHLEYRIIWPNGEIHYLQSVGQAEQDEAGKLTRIIGTLMDITERKHAEAAREELLAVFHATYTTMSDGLMVFDNALRLHEINPAAERLIGAKRAEMPTDPEELLAFLHLEKPDGQAITPDEMPIAGALRGNIVKEQLLIFHRQDGTRVWLSVSAAPIYYPRHQIHGVVAIFSDVTHLHA